MSTVVLQNDAMVFGSQSPYNRYITEPGAKEKFFAFIGNRNSKVLVDHLHIPIQAGSDPVLKGMKRKYDLEFFFKKIAEIRSIRPEISISTDVIVGFPGETDDLFKTTIDTCRRIGFSKLHVFPYSERRGTAASRMSGKIDEHEKRLGNALAYLMKYIEKTGEKIVYSKGLPQYFISDIMDEEDDEEIEEDIDYESFALEGFHEEELELDDFVNDEH